MTKIGPRMRVGDNYGCWVVGLVDIFLLKTRYAGLEAPPIRCLKHQKYGQVLIENMERSPIE